MASSRSAKSDTAPAAEQSTAAVSTPTAAPHREKPPWRRLVRAPVKPVYIKGWLYQWAMRPSTRPKRMAAGKKTPSSPARWSRRSHSPRVRHTAHRTPAAPNAPGQVTVTSPISKATEFIPRLLPAARWQSRSRRSPPVPSRTPAGSGVPRGRGPPRSARRPENRPWCSRAQASAGQPPGC